MLFAICFSRCTYANISTRIRKIGGDLKYRGSAIYMHLICKDRIVRRYVGQANDLKERLDNYKSPAFWKAHPCLHYTAWEGAEWDEFVVLAYLPEYSKASQDPASPDDVDNIPSLSRNVMEMWGSCIFQSLPTGMLKQYLPRENITEPQVHLNVASLLNQGTLRARRALYWPGASTDLLHKD